MSHNLLQTFTEALPKGSLLLNADDIFCAAIELSAPAERAAFIQRACEGDEGQLREVQELVQAYFQAGDFLEAPAGILTGPVESAIPEQPGATIGSYKLLEQIGEGGFAVVFMAEQEQPVRRRVALKLIKAGMDTKQVVARFEAERQALAMMDHPSIAKVFDAGSTETGRPYFVMELVKGVPITNYCDAHNLSIDQRIDLFMQVCQAVQHAHQKGVIHRDLKPTNILVSTQDDRALPKVIDFGIAKATEARLTEKTLFTDFRQLIGTPAYMSPEQADGSLDMDTRSDVYSLGVLLYELAAGSPPFDPKELRSKAFGEMQRIIREVEPPTPSTRLSSLAADTQAIKAAQRQTDPKHLGQLMRGELDWIVMRSLEKDRNRRYQTTGEMANDLARYRADQPVEARPPTRLYRFRKFARRNKAAVLTGAAITAALVAGLILASVGFMQARRQLARSDEVARFLKDTLAAAGPAVARGRDATLLREILDKTAQRVETDLSNQPEVQGDLSFTLGSTYADIHDFPHAISMFQHAVDGYRLAFGNENPKLALALSQLGRCQSFNKEVSTGAMNARLGLEMARKCGDQETIVICLLNMAKSFDFWGMTTTQGLPYVREAIALRKQQGNNPVALADCLSLLAGELDDDQESEALHRESLALHRQALGPDHPKVASDLFSLGQCLFMRGKFEESEIILRQAFDLRRLMFDKDEPYQPIVVRILAQALVSQGKWDEAESLINNELKASPSNSHYMNLLGILSAARQDWATANKRFAQALEINPNDVNAGLNLAIALLEAGQLDSYRQYCHEFLQRLPCVESAEATLLQPGANADLETAFRITEMATVGAVLKYDLVRLNDVKALGEYRRGQFDAAIASATQGSPFAYDAPPFNAASFFILAMAHVRSHQMEQAQAAFAKGVELADKPIKRDLLARWADWTIAEHLRREAELLLSSTPSTVANPEPDR